MFRVEKSTPRLFVCKNPQCLIATAIKFNLEAVRIYSIGLECRKTIILFWQFHTFAVYQQRFSFSCFHKNIAERCNSTENYSFRFYFASNLFIGMRLDVDWAREKFVSPCFDYFSVIVVVLRPFGCCFRLLGFRCSSRERFSASPFRKLFRLCLSKTKHSKGALDIIRCLLLMMWNVSLIVVEFK